ncbi:DUF3293 domain-containing protein [Streptomyces sp. NPDC002688]|uniref:DUF3293 domain-containing protein n=1 Tax=Streptomyces sp. NPDC002688 TaxID=3154423 RepID=UPI003325D1C8
MARFGIRFLGFGLQARASGVCLGGIGGNGHDRVASRSRWTPVVHVPHPGDLRFPTRHAWVRIRGRGSARGGQGGPSEGSDSLRAYRSHVGQNVGPFPIWPPRSPGTADGSFPEQAGDAALHAITAWNPRGRTSCAEYNAQAHGLLLDELDRRRLTWWPAAGGDVSGTHVEESVAVIGMSEDAARELGRHFGQDAIFTWTPEAWRVSACDGDTAAVSGWAASVRSGRTS